MNVVFRNKDFTTKIALPQPVTVERYSWNMIGGPDKAYLQAPNDGDAWELTKLLRCPIEIWGNDGQPHWWGFVNKVTIPHGNRMAVGMGLDAMYNRVMADWSTGTDSGTTTAALDQLSENEFGRKAKKLSVQNANETQAGKVRDLYLAEHKYPRPELEFSGGRNYVAIECLGWWQTLDWRYYTNTGTDNVEDTAQISAIITADGQLLGGTVIENTSGITSLETRDGKQTGLSYIKELLEAGTSNIRPLLSRVDVDRYLHIYERAVEPSEGTADYVMLPDGNLETNVGAYVPPEKCVCAAWVSVKGVTSPLVGMTQMRPIFIESAEYNIAQNQTTYRAADAFEQHRLEKYLEDQGNNGGLGGGETGGATTYWPYAWVHSRTVGSDPDESDSRNLVITSTNFANMTSTVVFTTQSPGLYLIGISGTCHDPYEQLAASISGDGSFIPLTGYVPQHSGVPYANGLTYAAVVTLAKLDASDPVTCVLGSGTSDATFDECYAWMQKVSN